jgi:oligopeptidase A
MLLERASSAAADKGLGGWLLALDSPTYQAVVTHAESRELRAHFYRAWVTRASELGPNPQRWDNGPLIAEILAMRHEAAQLLGFGNYAELSLATKMATSTQEVTKFLDDLAERVKGFAQREYASLVAFAGHPLEAWDIAFYAERLKQQQF